MSVYQEAYHLPEFTYDYEKLKIEQQYRDCHHQPPRGAECAEFHRDL